MRRLKVALISLLVIAFAPAGAAPPPPPPPFDFPPVVATQPLAGNGAVSFRFTAPEGADIGIQISAGAKNATISGDGVWLFDADGEPLFGFAGTGWSSGPQEVHVEGPDPVGVIVDVPPQRFRTAGESVLLLFGITAGEYEVVAGRASDGTWTTGGAVSLLGTEGVAALTTAAGEGGFAYRDRDFRGLNVSQGGLVLVRPLVMAAASVSASIDDELFGIFSGPFNGVSILTVDGPGGSTSGPDHFFFGEPGGEYTLTADLVAGIDSFTSVFAWGVDAVRAPAAA
jgi:hypothetical protein